MAQGTLHIGDAAALLGITPKAIRHYHRLGLLPEPARQANGYRLYTVDDLHRLRLILRLQAMGLTLNQIAFIMQADDADALLNDLLRARAAAISGEIARLQAQQAQIEAFTMAGQPLNAWESGGPPVSALHIVRASLQPVSHGLADVVEALETNVLAALDRFAWSDGYSDYWQQFSHALLAQVAKHEHVLILWLERYLALAALAPDDRQAAAWMAELQDGATRRILACTVALPEIDGLPLAEQTRLRRLMPLLIQQEATPLQREFISLVAGALLP